MGKPLSTVWCRKCVAAHPEGQHLNRPKAEPKVIIQSRVPEADITTKATIPPGTYKHLKLDMKKDHPPQPVTAPKPKKDQSVKGKKIKKAVMAATITAETRTPVPLIPPPKRQKPFKDPAKELARRRRQKADQMKRYRRARAKRRAEQGLDAKGDPV